MSTVTRFFFGTLELYCIVHKHTESNPLKLDTVEFWVDDSGPWKGKLSHDLPREKWNEENVFHAFCKLSDAAKV